MNPKRKVILVLLCLSPMTNPDRMSPAGVKAEQRSQQMSPTTHKSTVSSNDDGDIRRVRQMLSTLPPATTALFDDSGKHIVVRTTPEASEKLDHDNINLKREITSTAMTMVPFPSDDAQWNTPSIKTSASINVIVSDVEGIASNIRTESTATDKNDYKCRDDKTSTESTICDPGKNTKHEAAYLRANNVTNVIHEYFEELLNVSRKLCPYTRICDQSPLLELMNDALMPCCSDCSCDEDCGLRGDCCFEEMDKYKLKETYQLKCVDTKSRFSNIQQGSSSYLMVDKCLIDEANRLLIDESNRSANGKKANGIADDLLYPVYSTSTKLIYYNNATAVCNNVFDGVAWLRYLSCQRKRGEVSFSDVVAESMTEGLCWTDFVPPKIMVIKSFECHNDVINSCNITGDTYNYSSQTETSCKILKSTYQVTTYFRSNVYANVHCFKCNTNDFKSECYRFPPRGLPVQFTVLINEKAIEELFGDPPGALSKADSMGKYVNGCGHGYVQHPFKAECRLLKCAEGQYAVGEECQFISKEWYIWGAFSVELVLVPDYYIPVPDLLLTQGQEIKNLLKKKGFYWKFLYIYYHPILNTNSTLVEYLMIRLMKGMTTQFDLSWMILRLTETFKNGWNVKINTKKYKLSVHIDKGYYLISQKSDEVYEMIRQRFWGNDSDSELLYLLSKRNEISSHLVASVFVITKLYFCRKVQLKDEYLIDEFTLILFPNSTISKRLYSKEFSLAKFGESKDSSVVRNVHVCVDDFAPEPSVISRGCTHRGTTLHFNILQTLFSMYVIVMF